MIRNISSAKNQYHSLVKSCCVSNNNTCNHTPRPVSTKLLANRYYKNNIYNTLYKGNSNLSLNIGIISHRNTLKKKTRNKMVSNIKLPSKTHSMCTHNPYSSRITQLVPSINKNKGISMMNLLSKYNSSCNNNYQPKRKKSKLYLSNKSNNSLNKTKTMKKNNSNFNLFHKCFNITPLKKVSILQKINKFQNTRKKLIMKDQSASTMGDFKYISI